MSTMYGYEVKSIDDPCIAAADKSIVLGAHLGLPGSSIANIIPFLRHIPAWLPRPPSLDLADEVRRLTHEMQRIPMEYVKKSMVRCSTIVMIDSDIEGDTIFRKKALLCPPWFQISWRRRSP